MSRERKTTGFYTITPEPSGIVKDLVPYSKYKMFMVVANSRFESLPSNSVEFITAEDGEDTPYNKSHTRENVRFYNKH